MTETARQTETEPPRRQGRLRRQAGAPPVGDGPRAATASQGELDRLHASLDAVTPDNHPRTARLLTSSTRKIAQKVIEEAGEVALETVKHNTQAIVSESADLLYHLVALWHRAGIEPGSVWIEMRRRADELGIAEKPPKSRHRDSDPSMPAPKRTGDEHEQGK
ncbi:MAG: phosphoribosyl-ATP diphosphatase [Bradyrhizobium sp. PARBB1]|jgi:phosphoribosyl-ATP pyrophosphohydrolase|uniref:phosphoribosyl-ATP diphosphatase n=3 Tax=Bacteria TaxID=2 RepID=UPI0003962E74|nr:MULTISPECIES: phosphoribosyl-ATP diphosphatase [Bradyrhizobium]ERF80829.1 MAG: phosphoribosyl-ATP diphosphatase [Bradyrhizobium sp. DFCI-1]OYU61980.1 MAG: phosphoribosyl-ATP diphosphatase [Bradyrhizobium sp. PARBB1]PSO23077.1 phosphoribosyl-ATP diphosphatase [Bradyrhizobium sp. MOS004]QRI70191.1 phosphoribosyl-ATP diphosphatase [Bradyrhizobium sp. PSBB068]MCA3568629.1 phosphoribosyl-ATP diphosphatase [Bradyrhizobium sp.]